MIPILLDILWHYAAPFAIFAGCYLAWREHKRFCKERNDGKWWF